MSIGGRVLYDAVARKGGAIRSTVPHTNKSRALLPTHTHLHAVIQGQHAAICYLGQQQPPRKSLVLVLLARLPERERERVRERVKERERERRMREKRKGKRGREAGER